MVEEVYDPHTSLKVGELLIKEGFIKSGDIEKALILQQEEIAEAKLPVGEYMVKKGIVSQKQLEKLENHPDYQNMDLGELAFKLNIISKKNLNDIQNRERAQRSIGEILCDLNYITNADLNYILQKYQKHLKFGEILLKHDIIDEQKLNVALQEQSQGADPLGKILVQKKIITVDQLYHALSKQYNIPFRKLRNFVIYDNQVEYLTNIIGFRYARRNQIVPLSLKGDELTLAVYDHTKIPVIHELGHVYTHLTMKCVFISEEKFSEIFETLYGRILERSQAAGEGKAHAGKAGMIDIDLGDEAGELKEEKGAVRYGATSVEAEEIVNFIIKYGIVNHASDIHIEQNRVKPKIRYRIDGMLQPLKLSWLEDRLPEVVGAIISRIKVISNLDIAERRLPQDGVFRVNYFDREKKQSFDLDFRVATCPAIIGENVTMRILDSRKADVGLENLNHSEHVLEPFKTLLKSSAGMVLVSGPTGSGKTSTLYGALQHIYNPSIKIITAEDPIEYSFADIMQTQVNAKIGLDFARLLRSFLRFDPDVILVGEMRDAETASIGFDAALTGHLLLSTIHTNDAVSSITRLLDLEIERNQIASSLMGVLAQRLVRKTCPTCSRKYKPTRHEWSILFKKFPDHLTFFKGEGCSECNFSGYKGRTLISEIFSISRDVALALNKGEGLEVIRRQALEEGMKTMLDDGILKLDQTTLPEIIRVVPHEMMKEFRERQ
jgi:type IV pilus assembly protein PilB